MSTRVVPTFLLKGVDPNKILADYQAGVFSRKPVKKSKILISKNTAILAPIYGSTNQDPVFCVKDRNNCSVVIATTGHENLEVFNKNGGKMPVGGRCDHCKYDFNDVVIGYPLAFQEYTLLVNDSGDKPRYRIIYIFWVEGEYCSFECALGDIRQMLSRSSDYRDTTIRDSERMLKFLYKLMHPMAEVLRPSQDKKLLRSNRGSLTKEEWSDRRHIYIRTDRVLMIPAKVEYIRQNFLDPALTIDYSKDMILSS